MPLAVASRRRRGAHRAMPVTCWIVMRVNAGEINRAVLVQPQAYSVPTLFCWTDRQHLAAFDRIDPCFDATAIDAHQLEPIAAGDRSVRRLLFPFAGVIDAEPQHVRLAEHDTVQSAVEQVC